MNKKGFTLIELLIVVVIIGILAAIAIPRFGATRERAFISAMQSDLRQVMNAQELFYQTNDFEYATGIADALADTPTEIEGLEFTPSTGVRVEVTATDEAVDYRAVATHQNAPGITCEVYVGLAEAPGGVATAPGVIACDDTPAG
jgi:prepilin-type N-terminal cleavage/methylation domain-containing protein